MLFDTGGLHHENASAGRIGDRYFSVFLLLDHHWYEHHVWLGFGDAKILIQRKLFLSASDFLTAHLPFLYVYL